jgi:hypothetical protein
MKRIIIAATAIFFLITARRAYADEEVVYIPDPHLKAALVIYPPWGEPKIDLNRDGEIQVSEAKSFKGRLSIGGDEISDFTGINEFDSLNILRIDECNVSFGDFSGMECLGSVEFSNATFDSVSVADCKSLVKINTGYSYITSINLKNCFNITMLELTGRDNRLKNISHLQDCINLKKFSLYRAGIDEIQLNPNVKLEYCSLYSGSIKVIDFSEIEILRLACFYEENLKVTMLKNGNNHLITYFVIQDCPTLNCIEVDNPEYSEANWRNGDTTNFKFDNQIVFSTDCNSCIQDLNQDDISIYPNPAEEKLYLSGLSGELTDILIYDLIGNLKMSDFIEAGNTEQTIDISYLTPGAYLLLINNHSFKIIVK